MHMLTSAFNSVLSGGIIQGIEPGGLNAVSSRGFEGLMVYFA